MRTRDLLAAASRRSMRSSHECERRDSAIDETSRCLQRNTVVHTNTPARCSTFHLLFHQRTCSLGRRGLRRQNHNRARLSRHEFPPSQAEAIHWAQGPTCHITPSATYIYRKSWQPGMVDWASECGLAPSSERLRTQQNFARRRRSWEGVRTLA